MGKVGVKAVKGIALGALLLIPLVFNACGSSQTVLTENGNQNPFETPRTYFSTMTHLQVEVAYESGAEPFVGTTAGGLNYWDILAQNLGAVFQGRSVTVAVPHALSEMTALPVQNKTVWSVASILDLASRSRHGSSSSSLGNFFILIVNGYLDNGSGGSNTSVIGVSISGTNVIAIFKPVVRSTGYNPAGPVPRYVEQSTLVHEMGHALGLVNLGLPMTTSHQDTANGSHCTNTSCTMYWQNEGITAATAFVQHYIATGDVIMFGNECLNDAHSYHP